MYISTPCRIKVNKYVICLVKGFANKKHTNICYLICIRHAESWFSCLCTTRHDVRGCCTYYVKQILRRGFWFLGMEVINNVIIRICAPQSKDVFNGVLM